MQVKATAVHCGRAHPGWCDPRRCAQSDGDVEHRSAHVVLRTQDACLELAWVRSDVSDEGGAQQPGATERAVQPSPPPVVAL